MKRSDRSSRRDRLISHRRWGISLLAVILAAGACAPGGTSGSTSTPPPGSTTLTPVSCNTRATTTAIVWDEGRQIHGGVGGSAPTQLSSFSYPLGLPDEGFEGNPIVPGFLAVAPDGAHIAVDEAVFVPFTEELYPYVVDTATHAATRVLLPAYPYTPDEETRELAGMSRATTPPSSINSSPPRPREACCILRRSSLRHTPMAAVQPRF